MKRIDMMEELRLTDPDFFKEMCEVASMSKNEIDANLEEAHLQPTADLLAELQRLMTPSLLTRLAWRLLDLKSGVTQGALSFFFMPTRALFAFAGLTYLMVLMVSVCADPYSVERIQSTQGVVRPGNLSSDTVVTQIWQNDPHGGYWTDYNIPCNQQSVGPTIRKL